ncbi:hypothetical protein ROV96_19475 [Stenotrophomonas pavanii]|uniref:hypothetical protein n=1 Tax=Stenotrophomonas pavanii TaxID=487698 RepID=UPI00289603FB|nr:hypothetical protein [Stenotrophomonas pavanii]MDT3457368.1 hypothetical protein [Stenotrophomonas pavanii]MDT3466120.1 hypothetical protein [Stenotrophomonas pavanii]
MEVPEIFVALKEYWADVDQLTLIVALLACFVAWRTWRTQHMHNRLSVMPLPRFGLISSPTQILIRVENNGTGPLRVISFRYLGRNGEVMENLFSVLGPRGFNYVTTMDGRALSPNSTYDVLDFQPKSGDIGERLRQMASALSAFSVRLEYTDVYSTKFPPVIVDLAWFTKEG